MITDSDHTNERIGGKSGEPIRFGTVPPSKYRHVCAFFHSADEEYRWVLPFIKEAFDRGEKVFYVGDSELREEHGQRLRSAGIDAPAAEQRGQLEQRNWQETYLRDGRFEPDTMLTILRELFEQGRQQGVPLIRVVGHAEWRRRPGRVPMTSWCTKPG